MKNYKNYIIIFILLFILLIYEIGVGYGSNSEKNKTIDNQVKVLVLKNKITQKQVDSIKSLQPKIIEEKVKFIKTEKIIKDSIKKIVIEKPKDSACNYLYIKSSKKINLLEEQISIKDSIEKASDKLIYMKDLIITKQDSIIVNKDLQINLISSKKVKIKRFGIGLQVGYGVQIKNSRIEHKPYIGIGASYNIFNF
ncbi:MAG: hypothetical protein LBM02_10035 [Lachnospiraceae bacterium]|nr:hypothetical protein [Lachnospiraceae bacterium]